MDISICFAGAIFIKEVMCMTNYREIEVNSIFSQNQFLLNVGQFYAYMCLGVFLHIIYPRPISS